METIRKKVPYEGCTLESDKAGKMHTALLEMCMAPQTQCKTILLLQNVSFKMSESEHSLLEFYDLGELLDAEMLQLPVPTHTKATKRKSHLTNEEIKNYYKPSSGKCEKTT